MGYTKMMNKDSMLHIEVYDGSEGTASPSKKGNKSYKNVDNKTYGRRKDLIDPTMFATLSKE